MNNHLDKYLCKKYPKIFSNRYKSPKETCMCWGFEVRDGWFFLLDALCNSIQNYLDGHNEWVEKYSEDYKKKISKEHISKKMIEEQCTLIPQVVADQVKEKFGGLRFYYSGGDEKIRGMVTLAENLSYQICEKCGIMNENVNSTSKGYIRTLCSNCIDENFKKNHFKNRRKDIVTVFKKIKNEQSRRTKKEYNGWGK